MPAMTFNELAWHRSRLEQVIEKLRRAFPDAYLMYRTTTTSSHTISQTIDYSVAVSQINQSARALMKQLRIPLFHCKLSRRAEAVKVTPESRGISHHWR